MAEEQEYPKYPFPPSLRGGKHTRKEQIAQLRAMLHWVVEREPAHLAQLAAIPPDPNHHEIAQTAEEAISALAADCVVASVAKSPEAYQEFLFGMHQQIDMLFKPEDAGILP